MSGRTADSSLVRQRWLVAGATLALLVAGAAFAYAGGAWTPVLEPTARITSDRPVEALPIPSSPATLPPAAAADEAETPQAQGRPESDRDGQSEAKRPSDPEPAESSETVPRKPPRAEPEDDEDDRHETVTPEVRDEDDEDGEEDDESED